VKPLDSLSLAERTKYLVHVGRPSYRDIVMDESKDVLLFVYSSVKGTREKN
jgi:hypothetical protein